MKQVEYELLIDATFGSMDDRLFRMFCLLAASWYQLPKEQRLVIKDIVDKLD